MAGSRLRTSSLGLGLTLLLLVSLGCGGGGGGGGGQTFFLLAASSPMPLELNVPRDTPVTVTFNKALDLATVNTMSLTVTEEGTGRTIPGTTSVVPDGRDTSLRWTGQEILGEESVYNCAFSTDLRSVDAEQLAPPLSVRFGTNVVDPNVGIPETSDLVRSTGILGTGRSAHTATLLPDGRVLIVGGFTSGSNTTAICEVYDSTTQSFTTLGDTLATSRAEHTATVMSDGRVLIVGGYTLPGGGGGLVSTNTAEIFDPSTNTFSDTGTLQTDRGDHASVALTGGRVLVTGGSRLLGGVTTDLDTAEIYSLATGQFVLQSSRMIATRSTHGIVDTGVGRYVMGGGSATELREEWWDDTRLRFETLGQPASARGRFGPIVETFASGDVIIAGGDDLGTVLFVDRASGFVGNTGSGLARPRSFAAAARLGTDRIIVIGGIDFSQSGGLVLRTADVIVEGGPGQARTYTTPLTFSPALAFHTATTLDDGRVLICGGTNSTGGTNNIRDAYLLSP